MGGLDAELTETIARAVEARREEVVRLLQELVRVPAATGDEGAVQEVVERAFRERGLAVDAWEATPEEISPNKVPINVGLVRAGNWASTVPESLVAEGRVGLIPGEEIEAFREHQVSAGLLGVPSSGSGYTAGSSSAIIPVPESAILFISGVW